MKDLGPATEDDMIRAFVLAEIESDAFSPAIEHCLRQRGLTVEEVTVGLRSVDPRWNAVARVLLGDYRGYQRNAYLFVGFPTDVTWRNVQLEQTDFDELLYCSYPVWVQRSGGTRRVIDGAAVIGGRDAKIDGIVADVRRGKQYHPIIMVQETSGAPVVFEGHNRATAFAIAREFDVPAIIGYTSSLATWRWR